MRAGILAGMARTPHIPELLKRGPFTVDEARQAGIERWHLRGAHWRRVARGTYEWSRLPETPMSSLVALRRRLPQGFAFSGLTAGWLHGIDVRPCDPIEVTVTRASGVAARSGVRVRRALNLAEDVVQVRGLPATSIVRTIADVSSHATLTEAVVVADAALHLRRVTLCQLTSWAEGHAGHPGIRRLRRVIELAEPASESPMESRLRMVLVLGGLPRPKAQVPVHDRDGRFVARTDLFYERQRLAIEFDGAVHRTTLVADNRRQNQLFNAGVDLLRFTGADVLGDPASVVAQVRLALRRHLPSSRDAS